MSDLKDLLGSDDEDEEVINEFVPKTGEDELNEEEFASENVKEEPTTPRKNADLSNLLGESDEEDEMDIDDEKITTSQPKENELDKIFGEAVTDVNDQTRTRSKIKSQLNLPKAYKIQPKLKTIFLRMPNFVKIQPNPYESSYYDAEEEKREFDAATTAVIRYRFNKQDKIESNARILQWSDGSQQLVVGDAVFEMKTVPTENCYVFQQQLTKQINEEDETEAQKFHLECNGAIESRILLQPSSLDSEIHTRMTLKITEKNKREKKISIRDYETILEAPEKTLQKLIKQEEEELRKLRKQREQNSEGRSFMINTAPRRGPAMTADYLNDNDYEAEEPEEDTKPAFNLKSKPKPSKKSRGRRGDDEAEEDDDMDDERDNFSPDGSDDGESLGEEDSYSENEEDEEEEAVEDDEEEEEAVEDDEEDEESVEGEADSDEDRKKSKKKREKEESSSKKDKKKRKKEKKEKREKREKKEKKEKTKRKRDLEDNEDGEDDAVPLNTSTAAELQEEDEEDLNIPQRKKAKKAFVDSDEEEL